MTAEEIKQRMKELHIERHFLLSNTEITGGDKCMRINDRLHKRAEKLEREIMALNRRLVRGEFE